MTSKFTIRAKYFNVKARLLNDSFAHFLNAFHNSDYKSDNFYKILNSKCEKQISNSKIQSDSFIWPYTSDGFKFKPAGKCPISCVGLDGKPTIIDNCHDHDVLMNLCIICYDFVTKESKRLVGATIKVKSIRVLREM